MSDIKIQPSATGSATVTLTAPATGTARTVTLPDSTDTLAVNSDVTNKLPLAGGTMTGTISNFRSTGIDDNADAIAITIDSNENIGIGVTPKTWDSRKVLQIGGNGTLAGSASVGAGGYIQLLQNAYTDGTWKYISTDEAARLRSQDGHWNFDVASSGSADSSISWTECLKIWNNSATGPGFTVGTHNTNGSDRGYSCHIENNVIGHRNTARLTDQQTHWRFYNPNGQVGNINTSGSGTNYVTSSDYRLKENINYDWDATTRLKQLKPARFNFIADDTNTLVDGFIAHEVSSVVPEAISGTKDAVDANGDIDPQGIDQSKLVPLLVKTIQEQQTTIESLEARITTLEG